MIIAAVVDAQGQVQGHQTKNQYGQEGVLVQAVDVEEATGLLARRYAPGRFQEAEPD